MEILLFIGIFALIILLEIVPLAREQQWKELTASSLLLAVGFILSMLITFDVEFPYLGPAISDLVQRIVGI